MSWSFPYSSVHWKSALKLEHASWGRRCNKGWHYFSLPVFKSYALASVSLNVASYKRRSCSREPDIASVLDEKEELSGGLDSGPTCVFCEMVVIWAKHQLRKNNTEARIKNHLNQVPITSRIRLSLDHNTEWRECITLNTVMVIYCLFVAALWTPAQSKRSIPGGLQ